MSSLPVFVCHLFINDVSGSVSCGTDVIILVESHDQYDTNLLNVVSITEHNSRSSPAVAQMELTNSSEPGCFNAEERVEIVETPSVYNCQFDRMRQLLARKPTDEQTPSQIERPSHCWTEIQCGAATVLSEQSASRVDDMAAVWAAAVRDRIVF